jgi:hypothetical protein
MQFIFQNDAGKGSGSGNGDEIGSNVKHVHGSDRVTMLLCTLFVGIFSDLGSTTQVIMLAYLIMHPPYQMFFNLFFSRSTLLCPKKLRHLNQ